MDLKRIETLAKLMERNGLAHLRLREGDDELELTKPATGVPAPAPRPGSEISAALVQAEVAVMPPEADAGDNILTSPLVGCAYRAATPGGAPFVQPQSHVKKGQVLCIIEAMKVMNEFVSPRDGVISQVLFEDGQLVEFGQPLFQFV